MAPLVNQLPTRTLYVPTTTSPEDVGFVSLREVPKTGRPKKWLELIQSPSCQFSCTEWDVYIRWETDHSYAAWTTPRQDIWLLKILLKYPHFETQSAGVPSHLENKREQSYIIIIISICSMMMLWCNLFYVAFYHCSLIKKISSYWEQHECVTPKWVRKQLYPRS